jgi:hypothetical protein
MLAVLGVLGALLLVALVAGGLLSLIDGEL